MTTDHLKKDGIVRTDLYCHDCDKNFIASIDFDIDGNHVVQCPHCGHEHCRVIEEGRVTGDRWDSRFEKVPISERRVWKHHSMPLRTSSAQLFLRERWLNREQ